MSYILDALKTADAKRGRDSLPGLHAPAARIVFAAARREQRPWAWMLSGVAVVLLAWVLWWFGWHRPAPVSYPATAAPAVLQQPGAMAPLAAAPSPLPALPLPGAQPQPQPHAAPPAPAAEPSAGAAPTAQVAVVRPVAPLPAAPTVPQVDPKAPATATAAGRAAPPLAPAAARAGGPEAAPVAQPGRAAPSEPGPARDAAQARPAQPQVTLRASTLPQVDTPHARPASPARTGAGAAAPARIAQPAAGLASAEVRLYRLDELAPELRRELPPIAVNGASYSENPAHRMLIVNGQVLHEGEAAAPDLLLEEIRLKQAVFRFRGTRFALPY